MATVIDALVVELGFDNRDLEKKGPIAVDAIKKLETQANRTEKSVKKIGSTSKDASRGMGDLTRLVSGFLAVIGGTVAIKAFISDFIETNSQIDRLSKNLGLSVPTISAWSNATEKLGGSAAGLQGTLDMLSKSQTQLMLTGESSLIPYMSALGVSLAEVNGKARPVTDILLDLSDRFSHMDRTEANNLGRMMGLDQGTLNLLLQGRKELELEIRRQKEQTVVTKAQAEEATRLQRSIVGVKQSFAAFGRSLLMDATPTLERVFEFLQNIAEWAQRNKEFIGDFLKILAVGLGAVALAAMPINATALAVVALAAAFALLWDDYQTWAKGGKSAFNWGDFAEGIDTIRDAINAVAKGFENAYNWWMKLIHAPGVQKLIGNSIQVANAAIDILKGSSSKAAPVQPLNRRISSADIQKYFISQGWSAAQAAGIAANLLSESSGNSKAIGDKGTAFGLAQWHKDRQDAFAKRFGHSIQQSTPEEQLAFVQYELTQGSERAAGNALRKATTGQEAGSIISAQYERPLDASGEAARRGSFAQSIMGIPGASSVAASAPQGNRRAGTNVDRSIQTTIGEINIHTQATDAQGIAEDSEHAFDFLFSSQANYGLVE